MLRQRSNGTERLTAFVTLNLHAAGRVHALVPAQVRELRIRLEAYLAPKRLYAAVNVGVLLESAGSGKGLATFGTGVRPSSYMLGPDVPL